MLENVWEILKHTANEISGFFLIGWAIISEILGATIDGSTVEVTWAKPADKGEPIRSQNSRSGRQLMEWTLNGGDLTNAANYFIDPASALLATFNPIMLPGSG